MDTILLVKTVQSITVRNLCLRLYSAPILPRLRLEGI